jgi:NADH-quinone oxidoreductase subunit L
LTIDTATLPTPALLLSIATLLPLASFVLLMFVGKRMGTPLAGVVGTCFIAGSFVCSIIALNSWIAGGTYITSGQHVPWGYGKEPINITMPWIPTGSGVSQDHPGYLDVGVYVDSLTVLMFSMITLVATLVHIFSIGYMAEDKRFPRFFTYLGLFCFSMLGLVIGGTTLQLFIFWELVGLCSYLLIGFWYEKKSASNAAIKAFVVNRVGDFGFLIGFGILFYNLGNVTLPSMWVALGNAGSGGAITLANGHVFEASLLTIMGIGLFFGAVGKSAQFPLHVWLPDAMEGPTPVSALIHAATMVAAGVYLVGRIFPILTPDAKLFIAIIGATTLTMAALIALAQTDIKKVLAYSTLSQLGYMILAMGIGSWVGGLFHLITHAFFKALLFLGSGSVIHAAHHEQEMPQYGGLWRKIPMTFITFGIAVFAISGTPFFSGYYSKDMIIAHAGAFAQYATAAHGKSSWYWAFFYLPTIVAYITAFYMTRCWALTFLGKPRNKHLYDHAHEMPILWAPLAVLAILAVVGGYKVIGVQDLLENAQKETVTLCQRLAADKKPWTGFATAWPTAHQVELANTRGEEPVPEGEAGKLAQPGHGLPIHGEAEASKIAHPEEKSASMEAWETGEHLTHTYLLFGFCFAVGIGLGLAFYLPGYRIVGPIVAIWPLSMIRTWLYRRMLFDELYFTIFVGGVRVLSLISSTFDKYIIDGIVNAVASMVKDLSGFAGANDKYVIDGAVNGAATLAQELGTAVRSPQTGRIRVYVTVLVSAIALGLAGAIVVVLSK